MNAFRHNEYLSFTISDPAETELVLVSVHDARTNYWVRTALPNSGIQSASLMAFAGARYSRSALSASDLFKEIHTAGTNAQERLASIFRSYGHASVADMAQLFAYIENIPQIHALRFFNETSVGGGQERSTRYQDFSAQQLIELDHLLSGRHHELAERDPSFAEFRDQFRSIQQTSYRLYQSWSERLTQRYTEVFAIDPSKKKETIALQARVFDTARAFLLSGCSNTTSLAWITSAREWARLISYCKAQQDLRLVYLAEQLECLFAPDPQFAAQIGYAPEAPDLIRYTGADETTLSSLGKLAEALLVCRFPEDPPMRQHGRRFDLSVKLFGEEVSVAQKVLLQNVLCLYPLMDEEWFLRWEGTLSLEQTRKLGEALIGGFTHHKQMGMSYRVNGLSFLVDCTFAEARDLNRHRAWGRYAPLISAVENIPTILRDGYILPAYLTDHRELTAEREEFEKNLNELYGLIFAFTERALQTPWFPPTLTLDLIPFAHRVRWWLHGSVKEIDYLTRLRVRPGGHINYRITAYQIAEATAEHSPLLSSLAFQPEEKPRADSREQFLDRS
jgi:thymidylate synthase ThyX